MIKAKAALLKSLGNWTYDEIIIPNPGKDRAIIKILKSGICSTDVVRSMEVGFYSYPIVPGHEMLGHVYKLGSQNKNLKEGDKVCVYPLITKCSDDTCCGGCNTVYGIGKAPNLCSNYDFLGSRSHGGYAEFVSSPIKNLVKVPDNLDDDLAVFTEPASVALHAFKVAKQDRKFDSVIILGLGPIGILLASWCKLNNISNVIGVDRNENRFNNFKELGFKNIIDTKKDNIEEKINKFTLNDKVEIAFECSGSEELLNKGILNLKKSGKIVVLSNQIKKSTLYHNTLNKILRQEIQIKGSWSSVIDPHNEWEETLNMIDNNKLEIKNLISHHFRLSDAPNLFKSMYKKEFKFSKVVLSL